MHVYALYNNWCKWVENILAYADQFGDGYASFVNPSITLFINSPYAPKYSNSFSEVDRNIS